MKRSTLHLTARSVARTLLAGDRAPHALRARLAACIEAPSSWIDALAERLGHWPAYRWQQHDLESLARWLQHDGAFQSAWALGQPPRVRRYILRPLGRMRPLPVGLEACSVVPLHTPADLAAWLKLSPAALWRLCLPGDWQRRRPLGEQHYRFLPVPKPRGGLRLIEAPHPYLKALQRHVLDGLLSVLPVHEAAHGYTPGRSVLTHAAAHVGQAVVLKFDLEDFFANVTASRVHAIFHTLGYPRPVVRCLTALCSVATPEPVLLRLREEGGLSWRQAQRLRSGHLPQGAPTSPALANLCAFRLDLRLAGLAEAWGARYTRYADDLVISGGPELARQAPQLAARVAAIALEQGFRLNHRKTRRAGAGGQQRVCGIVVNQRVNLPRAEFDRLKAVLHRCGVRGPAAVDRPEGVTSLREHLLGRIAWAAQLNAAKAQRLARLYDRIDWGAEPPAPSTLTPP